MRVHKAEPRTKNPRSYSASMPSCYGLLSFCYSWKDATVYQEFFMTHELKQSFSMKFLILKCPK